MTPMRSLLLVLALAFPALAAATSYVPMRDEDLLSQTPIVVSGQVAALRETRIGRRTYSDYDIAVERVAKGRVAAGTLTLRVPGSLSPDGGAFIEGAPHFSRGERGVWFVKPRADQTFGVMQWMLGAFREQTSRSGEVILVRVLADAVAFGDAVPEGPRSRDRFLAWIERSARGPARADYFLDPSTVTHTAQAEFTLIDSTNKPRWTQFDAGRNVPWRAGEGGYLKADGVTLGGIPDFKKALKAWSDDEGSSILLKFAGTVVDPVNDPCTAPNVIVWDDPDEEISGSFLCGRGGVLAFGSPCYSGPKPGTANGKIFNADVVTQDGAGCFFETANGKNGAEVFAHEIGHTLGFGHSCGDSRSGTCAGSTAKDSALMRAFAHGDGRGAALKSDDKAAAASLYPPPPP